MPTFEDKKSLFVSLLYLKSESQILNMRNTIHALDQTIECALDEIGENPEIMDQLNAMRSFIDQAAQLPTNQLSNLVELIDYFDAETAHH